MIRTLEWLRYVPPVGERSSGGKDGALWNLSGDDSPDGGYRKKSRSCWTAHPHSKGLRRREDTRRPRQHSTITKETPEITIFQ